MAGHILPVIFRWHLKVQINAATVDTFAPDRDFRAHLEVPLAGQRQRNSIPRTDWINPVRGPDE